MLTYAEESTTIAEKMKKNKHTANTFRIPAFY